MQLPPWVKEGMLLYAAYPRKTPPRKAVRQFDFEYCLDCVAKF